MGILSRDNVRRMNPLLTPWPVLLDALLIDARNERHINENVRHVRRWTLCDSVWGIVASPCFSPRHKAHYKFRHHIPVKSNDLPAGRDPAVAESSAMEQDVYKQCFLVESMT